MTEPGDMQCVDCGRSAVKSYGTLWLCQEHWWAELSEILTRRPDLRDPIGIGILIGEHLRCDICGATWVGQPDEPCDWCQASIDATTALQAEIDKSRMRDYLERIAMGDFAAFKPCLPLVRRHHEALMQLAHALTRAIRTVREKAACE